MDIYKHLGNIFIVLLSSISGSVIWKTCEDFYYKRYIIRNDIKDFIKNFGIFIGFGLGISYVYTGKPLINNLLKY